MIMDTPDKLDKWVTAFSAIGVTALTFLTFWRRVRKDTASAQTTLITSRAAGEGIYVAGAEKIIAYFQGELDQLRKEVQECRERDEKARDEEFDRIKEIEALKNQNMSQAAQINALTAQNSSQAAEILQLRARIAGLETEVLKTKG